jgi:hypothetical protein
MKEEEIASFSVERFSKGKLSEFQQRQLEPMERQLSKAE